MIKILLLEDDPMLSKSLMRYLSLNNFSVDWAKNGEEAVDLSYENRYDLYLFDINVPLINGIDLLTLLRDAGDFTPTIIISALVDIESVSKGFIAGADDYVKKPFDPDELLIRIKAKTASLKSRLKYKDLTIDLDREEIFRDNQLVNIGDVQKNIFIALIREYPNPVVKDDLLMLLDKPTDLALRVNINKLKKSLSVDIKNVRGVGYKIESL